MYLTVARAMICIKRLNKRLPTAQGNALWVHNVLAAIKGDRWKTKIVAIHRETLPKAVFFLNIMHLPVCPSQIYTGGTVLHNKKEYWAHRYRLSRWESQFPLNIAEKRQRHNNMEITVTCTHLACSKETIKLITRNIAVM